MKCNEFYVFFYVKHFFKNEQFQKGEIVLQITQKIKGKEINNCF